MVVRGFGQLLMTLGVIVLLFCVYELKVTSIYTEQQQSELEKRLTRTGAAAPAASGQPGAEERPSLGAALAASYRLTRRRGQKSLGGTGVGRRYPCTTRRASAPASLAAGGFAPRATGRWTKR